MKPFEKLKETVVPDLPELTPEDWEQILVGLSAAFPESPETDELRFVDAWWQERASKPVEKLKPMAMRGDIGRLAIYLLGWIGGCNEAEWLFISFPNLVVNATVEELTLCQDAIARIRVRHSCPAPPTT